MPVTITIKPGTWVAKEPGGEWIMCECEPDPERFGWFSPKGMWTELEPEFFDLSSFPTFNEPDWRKTKFQVQP